MVGSVKVRVSASEDMVRRPMRHWEILGAWPTKEGLMQLMLRFVRGSSVRLVAGGVWGMERAGRVKVRRAKKMGRESIVARGFDEEMGCCLRAFTGRCLHTFISPLRVPSKTRHVEC